MFIDIYWCLLMFFGHIFLIYLSVDPGMVEMGAGM